MDMVLDLETGRCIDAKNMERQKQRKRKRKSRKGKENLGENIELCGFGENKQTAREISEIKEMEISNSGLQDTLLDVGLTVQSPIQKHLMDTTTNLEESKETKKKKKKRKPKKGKVNLGENMELCGVGGQKQTVSEISEVKEMESSNNGQQNTILDIALTLQPPIQEHLMDTTTNLEECKKKKKKKKKRKKLRNGKEKLGENKELSGFGEQKQTVCEILDVKEMNISNNGLQDTLLDVDLTGQSPVQKPLIVTATNLEENKKKKKKKNWKKKPKTQCGESLQSLDHTGVVSASSLSEDKQINDRAVSHLSPKRTPVARLRKKLLILDVNGLLADVVFPAPNKPKADAYIFGRACENAMRLYKLLNYVINVFLRPFCCEFLGFCFNRFHVAIWSSRSKNVLQRIVDHILGDRKHKLLFFWDTSRCTKTEFKTLENEDKSIVFKDLRKIWEKTDPNDPWEKGDYNESNTLLLDDSPYKALLNPAHTGIFPLPYSFKNRRDNSLGPVGDLRLYLDGLAKADNCKEYVEKHPFGQSAINESSSQWDFYSNIIRSQSNPQLLV